MNADSQTTRDKGRFGLLRRHPWLTAGIAVPLLAGVLFFRIDWQAEHRWQRYAEEARARGAKLHPADFTRPEIPAEQNFAELPMLKKAFVDPANDTLFKLPKKPRPEGTAKGKKPAAFDDLPPYISDHKEIDWKEWQQYFLAVGFLTETSNSPAGDVLRALEHYSPQFAEWSEWRTTRPYCQLPSDLQKGNRIPLSMSPRIAMMFELRMQAHLATGNSPAAYADFQDCLQIPRLMREAPSAVEGALEVGVIVYLVDSMSRGLHDHSWAEAELKKIETDLAALRIWDAYRQAMEGERSTLNMEIEKFMATSFRQRGELGDYLGSLSSRPKIVYQLMPRSVFRDNEERLNQYIDELTAESDARGQPFDPDRQTPSSPVFLTSSYDKEYYFVADLVGDAYSKVEKQYLHLQIRLDQARLACALERFRIARGAYPATLTELTPEFLRELPVDIYARAPYRYRRANTESFLLYSVGENRKDDGGAINRSGPEEPPLDRVWPFAPPATK